ncbi:MAG: nucleotidyltransferase domain-containing protein [Bacteroidales bacterium]|nr:nucleotidyltransferase domain-containing protein [Bacteroidales bacterium]
MEQEKVLEHIKKIAIQSFPEGASLWLYGSRARGEACSDSDYDLLILVDSEKMIPEADKTAYEICLMGYDNGVEINPHIYPVDKWNSWTFTPFYKNVEKDKIRLL